LLNTSELPPPSTEKSAAQLTCSQLFEHAKLNKKFRLSKHFYRKNRTKTTFFFSHPHSTTHHREQQLHIDTNNNQPMKQEKGTQ
jgi:hypothetical protein